MSVRTMPVPLGIVRAPTVLLRRIPTDAGPYRRQRQRRGKVSDQGLTIEVSPIPPSRPATTDIRTGNALASASPTSSASVSVPSSTPAKANPQRSINIATITLSVLLSIAMVIILTWYLRLRRRENRAAEARNHQVPREMQAQASRVMLPLQTSFHPSFKSSFGLTGASPDSPWSRTDGTIIPLTRAAGQEFLYSPIVTSSTLVDSPVAPSATRSPTKLKALPLLSATLPAPPVTANTTRTFRTSIHSIMVNRDSFTTHNPSIAEDLFPPSSRPRTRLPSYHTDYHKSATSPYAADLKKGFIPGPESPSTQSSPSETCNPNPIPAVPPIPQSAFTLASPTQHTSTHARTKSGSRYQAPPTFRHVTSRKKSAPRVPLLRTRESLKEYLDNASTEDDDPSSTASMRVRINTDSPSSARPSMSSHTLSDDLRGLLFLAPSVVVDDRPRSRDPANPDLSPTAGWTGLPHGGRKLV